MTAVPTISLEFDAPRGLLWRDREPVRLHPRHVAILAYFLRRRHRLVTHGELAECGWGRKSLSVGVIRMEIHRLRLLIGPGAIETVFGLGYRLVGDVREVVPGAPQRDR